MRQAVKERLGQYDAMCQAAVNLPAGREKNAARLWVQQMRRALSVLSPQERLVVGKLYVCPGKKQVELLCQLLDKSPATVYRIRDRAVDKIALALFGK